MARKQPEELIDESTEDTVTETTEATGENGQTGHRVEIVSAGTKPEEGAANAGYVDEDGKVNAEVSWEPGDTLGESVSKYGEEVVHEYFIAQGNRNLGNLIRARLAAGGLPDTVVSELADWKPGVTQRTARAPEDNVLANFDKLSPEKQQEILAQLMAKAGVQEPS